MSVKKSREMTDDRETNEPNTTLVPGGGGGEGGKDDRKKTSAPLFPSLQPSRENIHRFKTRVADPDPLFTLMWIRTLLFTLMLVRILLLIEVICESATTDLGTAQILFLSLQNASIVSVHGLPRLHFGL
jgi:hypothetical protein